MKVPLLDLRRTSALDTAMTDAFTRVLRSGHYILGPEVDAFEKQAAGYVGAKHALGVSSGTDALLLALMALGVGPGDEVICPTFTFFASAGTIHRTGATPVFVDIDPVTYNTTAELVAHKLTPKTKAVMPVHLFGQCADMTAIRQAAGKIPVIEDAAQALGAKHRDQQAGTYGDFGCFSFFPSKNLGALGDAGLLTTDDDDLAERARTLRVHGGKPKYHHSLVGGNFRIDALQSALLAVRLPSLDAATAHRQQNARRYDALLANAKGVETPKNTQSRHIYNQYTLRVKDGRRDALQAHLKEKGVGTEIYYPVPLHLQPCFAHLGHQPGDFPAAEAAAREVLSLPIFPELSTDELAYVAEQVCAFAK